MSFITGRAAVVAACSRSEPALFGARIFTTASSFCPWTRVLRPDTDADADADADPDADPDALAPLCLPSARFLGNKPSEGGAARTHNDVSRSYGDSGTWNFPWPCPTTRNSRALLFGQRIALKSLAKLVPSLFSPRILPPSYSSDFILQPTEGFFRPLSSSFVDDSKGGEGEGGEGSRNEVIEGWEGERYRARRV